MAGRKAIILGAGITGLSSAWKLAEAGYQVTVIERNDYVGGLASTFRHGEFLLDFGPHKLTTLMDDIMDEVKELIGEELLTVPKQTRIFLNGRFLNYPVRAKDVFAGVGLMTGLKCGMSYMAALLKRLVSRPNDDSYYDWVTNRFGKQTADLVFNSFARKLWGDPHTLSKELAETRIALPNLFEVFVQMVLGIRRKGAVIATDEFYYPKYGTVTLAERLADKVRQNGGEIVLGETVTTMHRNQERFTVIETDRRTIYLDEGDVLVGTIPLGVVARITDPPMPEPVRDAVAALKTRNLVLIYLVLNKQRVTDDNWIFFPEEKYPFNRIYEQKGFSPYMGPDDKTVLCLELTPDAQSADWKSSDADLAARCIAQLEEIGLITSDEVIEQFAVRLGGVYQIYDKEFRQNTGRVFDYLDGLTNYYSIGRHGGFNYVGQCDCMDMGFRTSAYIVESQRSATRNELRAQFDHYAVLD